MAFSTTRRRSGVTSSSSGRRHVSERGIPRAPPFGNQGLRRPWNGRILRSGRSCGWQDRRYARDLGRVAILARAWCTVLLRPFRSVPSRGTWQMSGRCSEGSLTLDEWRRSRRGIRIVQSGRQAGSHHRIFPGNRTRHRARARRVWRLRGSERTRAQQA
jgi:hypothetical protein